jgi:transcriptional regulator with XRE-family HTH domain
MDKLTRIRIAAKIAELRHKKGLTQRQLADLVDKPYSYIALLETAKKNATLRTLTLIASKLGAHVDIIEDEE